MRWLKASTWALRGGKMGVDVIFVGIRPMLYRISHIFFKNFYAGIFFSGSNDSRMRRLCQRRRIELGRAWAAKIFAHRRRARDPLATNHFSSGDASPYSLTDTYSHFSSPKNKKFPRSSRKWALSSSDRSCGIFLVINIQVVKCVKKLIYITFI